jgi:hypothetical protein
MPRATSIPPAVSAARSRIEFKLEILTMFRDKIEHLTNDLNKYPVGSKAYVEADKLVTEFRLFRMEIEAIEFKVASQSNAMKG